jgi:hypothetical protein
MTIREFAGTLSLRELHTSRRGAYTTVSQKRSPLQRERNVPTITFSPMFVGNAGEITE